MPAVREVEAAGRGAPWRGGEPILGTGEGGDLPSVAAHSDGLRPGRLDSGKVKER
jgi:hypothetical protein